MIDDSKFLIVKGIDTDLILDQYKNTNMYPVLILPNEVHFIRV